MTRPILTLSLILLVVTGGCGRVAAPGYTAVASEPAPPAKSETAAESQPPNDQPPDERRPADPRVGDWPRWRGAQGDGISRETGWSHQWPESGPPSLWRRQVGIGFSSVAVVGDRLYTMGHADGQDTVWCLNAATGQDVWKFSYPCELMNNLHEGGPAATPTVDDGRVYTVSKEGHLHCFDAEKGSILWKGSLQESAEVATPEWGFSASVVIAGDKAIVEAGRLLAFDKRTGKLLWRTADSSRPGYGAPLLWRRAGRDLVATLNNDALLVAALEDGTKVASFPFETDYATTASTPVPVGEGQLFISSGYNRGCVLLRLEGATLTPAYDLKTMRNHMATCVLWQGHLYGVDGNSHSRRNCNLVCIEAATGAVKWKSGGLGCGSLFIADGKLIVLGDEGLLTVADASPEAYREHARATVVQGRCWTLPVLAHGRLYSRTAAGELACLDLRKPAAPPPRPA